VIRKRERKIIFAGLRGLKKNVAKSISPKVSESEETPPQQIYSSQLLLPHGLSPNHNGSTEHKYPRLFIPEPNRNQATPRGIEKKILYPQHPARHKVHSEHLAKIC
jgi:hypothetical protein